MPSVARRVHVLAEGLVQGVFFRASTRDEARRRGVTGWVRNLPDGRVEAEFQGHAGDVEAMVAFCRDGPGDAVVRDLEVDERDPVAGEDAFRVR